MEESVEDRVARLEQQVAALQRHLGVDLSRAEGRRFPPEFYEALRHGKTIKAIAIYRKETGASLRDAKKAVEDMRRGAGSGF
ncbi:hypothetical protein [Nonomuraea gerenzanensis]|uniref:Ribosomal protein L7/L12 C-terminal domain-containing protein n=1 Tax=Nonomuraea gerenzanensis TaxID=93944 RepID=A0A1M4DZW4_9ACTN|nr:hypothetical protein [Nonomuraea gerenzanensis]UBU14395.1 hypothetical protein LCN96_05055 [Nonomuraea gerenzanensis]SBO92107.1 hypothetical protein BN4615_P1621 [Nonomuraea gerenzanensis]